MHFNDISIVIRSSGVNIPNYLSSGDLEKYSSTGVYPHYLYWPNTSYAVCVLIPLGKEVPEKIRTSITQDLYQGEVEWIKKLTVSLPS